MMMMKMTMIITVRSSMSIDNAAKNYFRERGLIFFIQAIVVLTEVDR